MIGTLNVNNSIIQGNGGNGINLLGDDVNSVHTGNRSALREWPGGYPRVS